MDKNYTPEELNSYTVDELKSIARRLNLKTTGRKQELINNILNGETTYLDVMPKDVLNMVEDYKIYNNPNNQFLIFLVDLIKWVIKQTDAWIKDDQSFQMPQEMKDYRSYITTNIYADKVLNKFFSDHNLDIQFIKGTDWTNKDRIIDIKMGKLPFINDKLMAGILLEMVISGQIFNGLNKIMHDKDLPFLLADIGKMSKPEYIIMYGGKFL